MWPAVIAVHPVQHNILYISPLPQVPAPMPVGPTPNTPTFPTPAPAVGPTTNNPTFSVPTPAPVLTPTPVAIPQVMVGAGGHEMKKNIIAQARRKIVQLMVIECAVPNKAGRKSMIVCTISSTIQSATGDSVATPPKGIECEIRETMCEVRHVFKTYALYHLHREFSLRPTQGQPQTINTYWATRVRELLGSYEFLREDPSLPLFSSPFFENFILDTLTLFPFQLGSFIDSMHFNNIFSLAGTAIIAALHDFDEGVYKPCSLDGETW